MNKLWFRAQSLDNQSLDPMKVVDLMEIENKRYLSEEDVNKRQKLAQEISEVSSKGEEIFSENSHSAFLHGSKFLLKTPSDELDESGRIAPLFCYGYVPDNPSKSWSSEVIDFLVGFAKGIERTVSDESQKVAHEGVQKIVEERKRRKNVEKTLKWVGLGATMAATILAFIIKKKKGRNEGIDQEMGRRNQNLVLGIIVVLSVSLLATVILSKK